MIQKYCLTLTYHKKLSRMRLFRFIGTCMCVLRRWLEKNVFLREIPDDSIHTLLLRTGYIAISAFLLAVKSSVSFLLHPSLGLASPFCVLGCSGKQTWTEMQSPLVVPQATLSPSASEVRITFLFVIRLQMK